MGKTKEIPVPYDRSLDTTPNVMSQLQQELEFVRYYKTPEDIEQYKNYILMSQFPEDVASPFKEVAPGKAVFDWFFTPPEETPEELAKKSPESQAFTDIRNRLVKFKGKLPEPSFFEKVVNGSMTGGWVKMLTGDNFVGEDNDFSVGDSGYRWKGAKLNLTEDQNRAVSDFIGRVTGTDRENDFLDSVIQTAASLSFDLPLMYLTGGVAGGIMKAGSVTATLARSTQILPRLLGQIMQQSINFNLLGVPQTVEAAKDMGFGGLTNSVWHSTMMGMLAAGTGTAGVGIGKGIAKAFSNSNPALVEEVAGLGGSFGFGYLSSRIGGESNEDAIATGLAFAATHFTNPRAYRRVIESVKNKDIRIYTDANKNPFNNDEYYLEKDGKYIKIDQKEFSDKGNIVPLDVEPIEVNDANRKNFITYNQKVNTRTESFMRSLAFERSRRNAKTLYDRWIKDLDPEYVKQNSADIKYLADMTSVIMTGEKLSKIFSKWKLPADKDLDNALISINNKWGLSYQHLKDYVVRNLPEFLANPDKFLATLEADGKIPKTYKKDIQKAFEAAGEAVVKQSYRNTVDLTTYDITTKKPTTEPLEGISDILVDAQGRPIRSTEASGLTDREVKEFGTQEFIKPGKSYDRYDILGKTVDIEPTKEGNVKVKGTDYEFKPDPEKIVKVTPEGEVKVGDKVWYVSANQEHSGIVKGFEGKDKVRIEDTKTKMTVPVPLDKINKGAEYGKEPTRKNEGKGETGETITGFRAQEEGELRMTVGEMATEGEGYYIAKHKEVANFFADEGKPTKEIKFKKPKNVLEITKEDVLPINIENAPDDMLDAGIDISKPIQSNEKGWNKIYHQAWLDTFKGEEPFAEMDKVKTGEFAKNLTKRLKEAGYDAVDAGEWYVILDKDLIMPDKVVENVSKSEKSNVIASESKSEKVEPEVKSEEKIEPTKPIEEFSEPEIISLKNPIVETIDKNKGKGFNVSDEGIKEPLDKVYEKAKQLADQKNVELAQDPENLTKKGELKKSKAYDPEHFVVKMLGTGQPQLSSNQIARILEQMNPERYRGTTGEDIDNMFRSGKLAGVSRFAKAKSEPEVTVSKTEAGEAGLSMDMPPEKKEIEAEAAIDVDVLADTIQKFQKLATPFERGGQTFGQLIDKFEKAGKMNADEAQLLRNMYGRNLKELYEETAPKVPEPEKVKTLIEDFNTQMSKDFPNVKMVDAELPQSGLPADKVKAGVTLIGEDGITAKLDLRFADTETFNHEKFHILSRLASDRTFVNSQLKKYGWDGKEEGGYSWRMANENFVNAYLDYIRGTGPQVRGFEKLKYFFNKMARWLGVNGYTKQSYFFKDLAEGNLKLSKYERYNRGNDILFETAKSEVAKLAPNTVRTVLRSFDKYIKPTETIVINDAFFNRLENIPSKSEEKRFLQNIALDLLNSGNTKMTGEEFMFRVMEKMYPIQINRITYKLNSPDMETSFPGIERPADLTGTPNREFAQYTAISPDKAIKQNYGIWSFDLPLKIRQIHDYWGNRTSSMGWMRGYESPDGKTFYVNEIQSQLQYTKSLDYPYVAEPKIMPEELYEAGVAREGKGYRKGEGEDFMQSLQPNWDKFMIRSIIQWAADNGYTRVKFPAGTAAAKIEGFQNIPQEMARSKEYIKTLESDLEQIKTDKGLMRYIKDQYLVDKLEDLYDKEYFPGGIKTDINQVRKDIGDSITSEINGTKQHLQDLMGTPSKVLRFYEENVGFYGQKYRKNNWRRITEEVPSGRVDARAKDIMTPIEWFETDIKPEDVRPIELYEIANKPIATSSEEQRRHEDALYNWDRNSDKPLDLGIMANKALKMSLMSDIPSETADKVKNLWALMTPPGYAKHWMPHFADIRESGEHWITRMAREAAGQTLREQWRVKKEGKNYFRNLPDELKEDLMRKYENYHQDLYAGRYTNKKGNTKSLTAEEFRKEYKLTPEQITVDKFYQNAVKKTIEIQKKGQKHIFMNLTKNLPAHLSDKKFKEFFPELEKVDYDKANEILATDVARKDAIADHLVSKMFDYGDTHYLNTTRPATPNTWIIEMTKGKERRSMYAESEKDARAKITEWESKGYNVAEGGYYRIGDLLKTGEYWNRLDAGQLRNLAALGHIPYNEPVLKKLEDAMKAGTFKQHTISKEFVPGMDYTPKELEANLERFINEGAGVYRMIGNMELTRKMEDWAADLNTLKKSTHTPASNFPELRDKYGMAGDKVTDADIRRLEKEYNYALKYVNNITHSDISIADGIRKLAFNVYLGLRPSFMFQQPFQIFQKVLPLAMSESGNGGKIFWDMLGQSIKAGQFIRANQKGLSEAELKSFGFDKELYDVYLRLQDMGKMGKVGVEELMDQMSDTKYFYEDRPAQKIYETFTRIVAAPSGGLEKFTRIQSLLTFYNIAKEKNLSGETMTKYIADRIDESMDQWGAAGRIPLLGSKKPHKAQDPFLKAIDKSFITFKTFSTHNLAMYEKLIRNRQWGALGVKAAVGTGLHGITKFPLLAGFFAIANLFTDNDTEYEFMEILDNLNDYVPGVGSTLSRGTFSLGGLDVANLFDERSVFPTDLYTSLRSYSAEGKVAEAMLGAPYGLTKDYLDASVAMYDFFKNKLLNEPMTEQEYKRIVKDFGKFFPLTFRNIFNAFSWNKDGVEIRGNTIIKRDDLSWKDVWYKAFSFQPIDVNKQIENYIYGFPAKFKRVEGEIDEIKKVRKEISSSDDYTPTEKTIELRKLADMLRDAMARKSAMLKTQEYREAIKTGLIK